MRSIHLQDIKSLFPNEFSDDPGLEIDEDYLRNLADMMGSHWGTVKSKEIEKSEYLNISYLSFMKR